MYVVILVTSLGINFEILRLLQGDPNIDFINWSHFREKKIYVEFNFIELSLIALKMHQFIYYFVVLDNAFSKTSIHIVQLVVLTINNQALK